MRRADSAPHAVAVVGAACRLPGGISTQDELWEALADARDLVTEVPADRFDTGLFLDPNPARPGRSYTSAGGFLKDIAGFDAEFFGISPREASRMDPQQRLVLEMAVEALDDAGVPLSAVAGSGTGVFMGAVHQAYGELQQCDPRSTNAYTMAGRSTGNVANRVSHALDLHGPSMAVDTACSSSLVAVHQACRALREGAGPLMLAGGVNVLLSPHGYIGFSKASMLSPRGRCHAFSAKADGYVRAEGGGVVVLKSLHRALRDGDRVHGVILAAGTNTDGRTGGLSLPSLRAQEALLREVYARAGVDADELAYVEAHGTGTAMGDPVECEAIGRALGRRRSPGNPLPIGSVKTNLGHLEPASGVAGLCKALLVLRERIIPPSLHGTPPNPAIDFDGWRLRTVTEPLPLTVEGRAVVGVNSFGFGGANAHVVLAGPPSAPPAPPVPTWRPLPVMVTARTPEALAEAAGRMSGFLSSAPRERFPDIAYTSCRRRTLHEHRTVVLATGPAEAARALAARTDGTPVATAKAVPRGKIVFVFSGNGSVWAGMGAGLLRETPVFREAVEACDALLREPLGWSVCEVLGAPPEAGRLERTEVAQPLLFTVQIALFALLRHRGFAPAAVMGHSVGEVAAAHAAGILDLPAAARVIAARSRAQAPTAGRGQMAAVGLPAEQAATELAAYDGRLELAADNSDEDVTVSGDTEALTALGKEVAARRVPFIRLPLDYAFHSRVMDPLHEPLTAELDGLAPAVPTLPMASTVTGRLIGPEDVLDARYWWHNVRRPVLFRQAARALHERGHDVFVEIGPHPVVTAYLRRLTAAGERAAAVVPTLTRGGDGRAAMDTAVCGLLAAGAEHDWSAYFPAPGRVVDLPGYPWQRERHWNGAPDWWTAARGPQDVEHPLLGARVAAVDPSWEGSLELSRTAWLADHKVGSAVVVPATAYVEMALAAGRRALGATVELSALGISRPLVLPAADTDLRLRVSLCEEDGTVRVTSGDTTADGDTEHARTRVRRLLAPAPPSLDLAALRAGMTKTMAGAELYARADEAGLAYGPAFRVLEELLVGDGAALASYRYESPDRAYEVHPALLDGALQTAGALLPADGPGPYLPVLIESLRTWQTPAPRGFIHARARATGDRDACWDFTVTDETGRVTVDMRGVWLRRSPAPDGSETTGWYTTVLRAAPRVGQLPQSGALPGSKELLRAAAPELGRIRAAWSGYPLTARCTALKELSAHFTAEAVRTLLPRATDFTPADLLDAGVLPQYDKLLAVLLSGAAEHGLLEKATDDRGYRQVRRPDPGRITRSFAERHPDDAAALALYSKCGSRLRDVLTGHDAAVEVLFGDDRHLVGQFYDQFCQVRPYHEVCRAVVTASTRTWPAGRPLRILEAGAGSGSLTAALLPYLPPERTAYTFTDISPSFFPPARQRLSSYDFVDYRCLDIEQDPVRQGFTEAGYDVIVLSSVLHATSDLRRTLRHLSRLLVDEGVLLAVEGADIQLLAPCFGLLEGFWQFTDGPLRTTSPLLTPRRWVDVLESDEYHDAVALYPGTTADGEKAGATLFARRRRRATRPTTAPSATSSSAQARSWIIAAGARHKDVAEALTAELGAAGHVDVRMTSPTDAAEDWAALLPDYGRTDIVLLLGDRAELPGTPVEKAVVNRAVDHAAVLRAIAAGCDRLPDAVACGLWVVGRPSGALPDDMASALTPVDAAAWGAARTLANEKRRLTVKRVSLERDGRSVDDARRLSGELLADSDEDEVVLTRGGRFVPRVVRRRHAETTPSRTGRTPFSLRLRPETGSGYRLTWAEGRDPVPAPDEVVVEVRAAALNYRDVMIATSLLPAGADDGNVSLDLGLECAGVVTAVGRDVPAFAPGDRVYGLVSGALSSHVAMRAASLAPIPTGMGFTEAATLPVAFVTVHYALGTLARLTAGETVLVHSGAGGVGLAVLQYARSCGAKMIATAGSPAKRGLLRLLGVEHALNSRDLSFADRVLELTGGRGVDVVVNSLAGEAIARGMETLRPYGRFVELGKRDVYADHRLSLWPFRKNLSYFAVDVRHALDHRPDLCADLMSQVAEKVGAGLYRPLPHHTYPADRVQEAFTCLQRAQHIGKVVVTFDERPPVAPRRVPFAPDPRATYLITGGLSGFGAATARWLAERGARHLTLLGRRGPATPGAEDLVRELGRAGAGAAVHAVDVTDATAMGRLLRDIDRGGRRLAGVLHAAMVLDDAPLPELDDDRYRAVLGPKVQGAMVLHELTRGRRLDFFVAYSSLSALVGNVHQAPYAAGNLFLEALIRDRRRQGLPGLAVGWGALAEVGYVARNQLGDVMRRMGLGHLRTRQALTALEDLLTADGDVAVVGQADWHTLARRMPVVRGPRFSALLSREDEGTGRPGMRLREQLETVDDREAERLVADALTRLLAGILQTVPERIDRTRSFEQMGVDSLMGAEFAEAIRRHLGCDLPLIEVVGSRDTADLAHRVAHRLKSAGNPSRPAAAPATEPVPPSDEG
ncbi:SDR family NAD(P)-dependent oxidoreductase [Streptomyces syringium]|uniref:SDR family NAD(P)-dependent oxidoreductase n=1 Tax=Streptomyces syringium TaxID=76729 RepID=UPI0033D6F74E